MTRTPLYIFNFYFLTFLFAILIPLTAFPNTDTISIPSPNFHQIRKVYIKTPNDKKYASDKVKYPVLYILDAQQEWLTNPLLSEIEYLQYTHDIPQMIIVMIPLVNREKECREGLQENEKSPLLEFLMMETEAALQSYNPSGLRILLGHSFSASFALSAFLKRPDFFDIVVAHSPIDRFESLILKFDSAYADKSSIPAYISFGSTHTSKDYWHRTIFNEIKSKHQSVMSKLHIYTSDVASHTSVPLVTTPEILSNIFLPFALRFDHIAKIDDNYKLKEQPGNTSELFTEVTNSSRLYGEFYAPEIPEINGIGSRYFENGYMDHALAIWEDIGINYYPNYYEFQMNVGELYLKKNPEKAALHLKIARLLIEGSSMPETEKTELLEMIRKLNAENSHKN
jgi:predicted alpha/beta superfamily hydrolase